MQRRIRVFTVLVLVLAFAGLSVAYDGAGLATKEPLNPTVHMVTSLDDAGSGTLREALAIVEAANSSISACNSAQAHRIEFAVSGTIFAESILRVRDSSCIVLDGGGQITIDGAQLMFRDTKHVIVRHMRSENSPDDGFTFWNCDYCILANNSCRDAEDECVGVVDGSQYVSVLDNIISYVDSGAQRGMIVARFMSGGVEGPATQPITVARNMFVDQIDRSPLLQGPRLKSTFVANNLICEWGRGTQGGNGTRMNGANGNVWFNYYCKFSDDAEDDAIGYGFGPAHHTYWLEGNVFEGAGLEQDVNAPECPVGASCAPLKNPVGPQAMHVDKLNPLDLPCVLSETAGARPLDAHDQTVVSEFNGGC